MTVMSDGDGYGDGDVDGDVDGDGDFCREIYRYINFLVLRGHCTAVWVKVCEVQFSEMSSRSCWNHFLAYYVTPN